MKSSSDLIVSTITMDFDSNANTGYVRVGSSSSQPNPEQQKNLNPQKQQQQQQNTPPNPCVDNLMINQTISTAIQNAMSSSISFGGHSQIKCIFGMYLADYNCNSINSYLAK
jgi:hypothetical protein